MIYVIGRDNTYWSGLTFGSLRYAKQYTDSAYVRKEADRLRAWVYILRDDGTVLPVAYT